MLPHERDFFISKIVCGYADIDNLRVYPPSASVMYQACKLYMNTYNECLDNEIPTENDMLEILVDIGLWDEQKESDVNKVVQDIEDFKIGLFDNCYRSEVRQDLRRKLEIAKEYQRKLNREAHIFDYATCEGIASFSKWHYLITNSIRNNKGKRITDFDFDLVQFLEKYQKQILSDTNIRELARTDPWISSWSISSKNIKMFKIRETDEQKRLLAWSKFYDSIHKSHECPHDSIIEDDDMLDGWVIKQRREREKDLAKKQGNDLVKNEKISKSQEIFLMADTVEDARKIEQLNDLHTQRIKENRNRIIQTKGKASQLDFTDVKLKYIEQLAEARGRAIKGT